MELILKKMQYHSSFRLHVRFVVDTVVVLVVKGRLSSNQWISTNESWDCCGCVEIMQHPVFTFVKGASTYTHLFIARVFVFWSVNIKYICFWYCWNSYLVVFKENMFCFVFFNKMKAEVNGDHHSCLDYALPSFIVARRNAVNDISPAEKKQLQMSLSYATDLKIRSWSQCRTSWEPLA